MKHYLKTFKTHSEYQTYINGNEALKPNVSYCKDINEVHYNPFSYADEYLTFVALENGTFQFPNSINYSLDNGETWTELAAETASPTVAAGKKIMWKGTLIPIQQGVGTFSATGNFNVQGNVMSLLYGDNFKGQTDLTGKDNAFYGLFNGNNKVVNANNLSLPATTLVNNCYSFMFQGCTSLTTAPELPATTLTLGCYSNMFDRCTGLTTAPELPATTLADWCYSEMFHGCTSLVAAPELPATTLAKKCYSNMFNDCTSLTTAPELLTTTLVDGCYNQMFNGCTSLTYIKCLATNPEYGGYTYLWVSGVASSGTFVKNVDTSWSNTGPGSGVPSGWTVETA